MLDADLRDTFNDYVAARRQALLRTAYLLTGTHADAEDLVQTALIKCVPKWRRIADNPEPYVRKVMVREAISRHRSRRWREAAVAEVPDGNTVGPDLDSQQDLRRALADLAPRQRAVIVLRFYEDLTEAQTADVLGIGVGTVKSQMRDALARLRIAMPTTP